MVLISPFESAEEESNILSENIPFKNRVLDVREDLKNAYSEGRRQYKSDDYVDLCENIGRAKEKLVIGVTGVDLYTEGLNFVFGTANLSGWGCVISTHRLGSGPQLIERMEKEAVHELGHVIGLNHCSDPNCVMHFSNSLSDTDRKSGWYCGRCEVEFERLRGKRDLNMMIKGEP